MAIKFLWAYDLPVTVNQIAVGTVHGSGLYKFLDCTHVVLFVITSMFALIL